MKYSGFFIFNTMDIHKDSTQIEIISEFGRIYLYDHNGADGIIQKLYNVLSKKVRWDDPDYLARMLFCEMIPFEFWESDSGFGIGTVLYESTNVLVTLDFPKQRVVIQSILDKHAIESFSFESFVESFASKAKL